jgi:type IV secretory pathway TrbD component
MDTRTIILVPGRERGIHYLLAHLAALLALLAATWWALWPVLRWLLTVLSTMRDAL